MPTFLSEEEEEVEDEVEQEKEDESEGFDMVSCVLFVQ